MVSSYIPFFSQYIFTLKATIWARSRCKGDTGGGAKKRVYYAWLWGGAVWEGWDEIGQNEMTVCYGGTAVGGRGGRKNIILDTLKCK